MRRFLILGLLLSIALIVPHSAMAQWTLVQPATVHAGAGSGASSIAGKNIWLGGQLLFKSTDQGLTWNSDPSWPQGIVAMHFYDENNGAVTASIGAFRTTNGGQTWQQILNVFGARGIGYCGSPDNIIVAAGISIGELSVTTDGGKSWRVHPTDQWNHDVATSNTGIAYVMASHASDPPSWVWRTTDFGASWTKLDPELPYDVYSLAIDSCDPNIVYAMNEDYAGTDDGFSQVYQSTNAGDSWQVVTDEERLYFNGAIYVTRQAVYAPALPQGNGIRRSTDVGKTWIDIGGPGLPDDSRVFCSINDSILIAVDDDGGIWHTTNAGGFLFPPSSRSSTASISPDEITLDTTDICEDSLFMTIYVRGSGCGASVSVTSQTLIGADAALFAITDGIESYNGNDSIRISFTPTEAGNHVTTLEVVLSDGTKLISLLNAFVKAGNKATLSSLDIQNDTIGGEIRIPIRFLGGDSKSNIEFLLRYDTSSLDFQGVFDLSGNSIEDVNYTNTGTAKVRVSPFLFSSEEEIGYAVFKVYPNREPCTEVMIDSMTAFGPFIECLTLEPKQLTVNICSIEGCGIDRLSELVRYGKLRTRLQIHPNPTDVSVKILADGAQGEARYEIVDVEGRIVRSASVTLDDTSFDVSLAGLSAGTYVVRLTSATDTMFGLIQKR